MRVAAPEAGMNLERRPSSRAWSKRWMWAAASSVLRVRMPSSGVQGRSRTGGGGGARRRSCWRLTSSTVKPRARMSSRSRGEKVAAMGSAQGGRVDGVGGVGHGDAALGELLQHGEIDRLLDVHVADVVG